MADNIEVCRYEDLGSFGVPGRMKYVSRSTAAKNGLYKDTGAAWTLVWAEAQAATVTGVALSTAGIHAALVTLGLITA